MDWTGCEAVEQVVGRTGSFAVRNSDISPESVLAYFEQDNVLYDIAAQLGLPVKDVSQVLQFAFVQDWTGVDSSVFARITAPPIDWRGCEHVEHIPGLMGGVPVVRGSRVAAETIVLGMLIGQSARELAYLFTLKLSEVTGVIAHAGRQLPLAKAG